MKLDVLTNLNQARHKRSGNSLAGKQTAGRQPERIGATNSFAFFQAGGQV